MELHLKQKKKFSHAEHSGKWEDTGLSLCVPNDEKSVFSGNTYKVLNIVLGKPLFGMQMRLTGLGWFLKSQFA